MIGASSFSRGVEREEWHEALFSAFGDLDDMSSGIDRFLKVRGTFGKMANLG